MKKILFPLVLIMMSTAVLAQDAIDQFYKQYAASETFTKVNISGKMFELFAHIEGETEEERELLEAISKVDRLRVLTSNSLDNTAEAYADAVNAPSRDYEVLMTVEDDDEDFTFFIKEKQGIVSELLMVALGADDLIILTLTGDIDLNQLARISRAMDIDGLNYLEKVD